jgi:hypothetical protein
MNDTDNLFYENATELMVNNSAPYFFNITLYPTITHFNGTINFNLNGSYTIGELDLDRLNISTFWYINDVIMVSNNTAGSNMTNITNTNVNGSQKYVSGNITNPTYSNYKLGIYACDSWSCNQSNSSTLYIFENKSITGADFVVRILSNRSDGLMGFGTNVSVNNYLFNGSNDEIIENRNLLYLPGGGLLYNSNNSVNYNQYYWNSSFSTYLNTSGTYIAEDCYRTIWGLKDCRNITYEVIDSVYILPNFFAFSQNIGEVLAYFNFTEVYHNSPETFNFSFNWTDDIVLDARYFNSTFNYNSFTIGNNEKKSNYIILNISSGLTTISNYSDTIMITRDSLINGVNRTWSIPVYIGIDPPSGIPVASDSSLRKCGETGASCDIIEDRKIDSSATIIKTYYINNSGGSPLKNCDIRMDWANGSLTVNPSFTCYASGSEYGTCLVGGRFDIPINKWVRIDTNFGSSFSRGNYTGNVEVECVASFSELYNRTLSTASSPDNHPKFLLYVNGLSSGGTGGPGGGGGSTPPPRPSLIPLGGNCTVNTKCSTGLCDLAFNDLNANNAFDAGEEISRYYKTCITSDMRCGNGICESKDGLENQDNCKEDCGISGKLLLGIQPWIWGLFGGLILLIIILYYSEEIKKKKKKVKKNEKSK